MKCERRSQEPDRATGESRTAVDEMGVAGTAASRADRESRTAGFGTRCEGRHLLGSNVNPLCDIAAVHGALPASMPVLGMRCACHSITAAGRELLVMRCEMLLAAAYAYDFLYTFGANGAAATGVPFPLRRAGF